MRKSFTLPLYYQIYQKLLKQINSGVYPPGSTLPTEQDLIKMFNTSRAPVRQAFDLLKSEGLITRYPGKGTFVAESPEEMLLWFNFSPFRKSFSKYWKTISAKAVRIEMRQPPEAVRNFLMLGSKEKAGYLERVRYVGDQPVIFSEHYIQPYLDVTTLTQLNDFFSIRALLREHFSVEITHIEDSLRAVLVPAGVAKHLNLDEGSPVLRAERRSYTKEAPMQFDFFYTRTDIWDYNVAFKKCLDGTTSAMAVESQPEG